MDVAVGPPPTSSAVSGQSGGGARLWRLAPWLALGLVLGGYGFLLGYHFAPAISTPDANGYWAQGSLLATTGRTWFVPESDVQYIGMHWLVTEDGRYFSRYPPGLAVPIAMAYKAFGYAATVLINPVLSLLGLLGLYLLARRLAGAWWGVLAAVALAVTPDYVRHSLQNDSHMAVTVLLIWGLWLLLRWHQGGRWGDLLAAGLVLGAIPTVRYPEALYALGVGGLLLLHVWRVPGRRWHALVGLAGALVPLVPLMVRNQLSFGAFWRTAYSLTNEQTGFGWDYFQTHAVAYVRALNADGVGLFFGLGLVGMALLCARRQDRPWGVCLVLMVVPVTLLYMAYYWAPGRLGGEAAAMRFVLPTFACYYLAGVWALRLLAEAAPGRTALAVGLVAGAVQVMWGGFTIADELPRQCSSRKALARLTRELDARVPAGAVVISSQPVLQHLDFVRHWRCADVTVLRPRIGRPGLRPGSDPGAPAPMQEEKRRIEAEKYEGQGLFGRERAIAYDLREWASGEAVYFVGSEAEMQRLAPSYLGGRYLEVVARVAMPAAPAGERSGGGRPGLGGRFAPAGPGGGGGLPPFPGGGPGAAGPGGGLAGGPPGAGLMAAGLAGGFPGGPPGAAPGGPAGARLPRLQGALGGLMGLSPETREVVIARWTWQPAGPR